MKIIYLSGIILIIYYICKNNAIKILFTHKYKKYTPNNIINEKIFSNKVLDIMLKNDIKVMKKPYQYIKIYDINKITDFLNNNYSKTCYYLNKYFDWLLNSPHQQINTISHLPRNTWNIGLKKFNKLISIMCLRPMVISINNNIMKSYWVDYICVKNKFRKKGYATEMELQGLNEVAKSDFDNMFYLIDNKKLMKKPICKIDYYILNLNDFKIKNKNDLQTFSPDRINDAFELYKNLIKTKNIYQLLTLKEFIYYFKPKKDIIYTFVSKKTLCVVTLFYFKLNNYVCHLPNICLFLTSGNHVNELKKIFSIFKKKKYNNMIINNTFKISKFKKKMKYEGSSYLHGFNYYTNIKPQEFGIPLF